MLTGVARMDLIFMAGSEGLPQSGPQAAQSKLTFSTAGFYLR